MKVSFCLAQDQHTAPTTARRVFGQGVASSTTQSTGNLHGLLVFTAQSLKQGTAVSLQL